ncbi:NAD+ synthase [Catenovulum sediminis]|uniref:Glutamine-dependent NAD(+) synthetase n=1 Tax=Catenovulum sediminis TaxID=1740262 RepID=A0ABV1RCF5_9ALTE|nr:NAD+ synthase [Catenovulum sediminis]
MQILIAQCNFTVGAIAQNYQLIIDTVKAAPQGSVVVFPELALTGYPPEDLLLRPDLYERLNEAVEKIQQASAQHVIVFGHPWQENERTYNAASVYYQGNLLARYFKQALPNYGVFDEKRYFAAGDRACTFEYQNYKVALLICEDLWDDQPIAKFDGQGVDLLLSLNASPFNLEKQNEREALIKKRSENHNLPIVYVNHVCGQDELVFDGASFAVNRNAELVTRLPFCQSATQLVEYDQDLQISEIADLPESEEAEIYQSLVLATRDYVQKNGFSGAVLGLSGGIDSALTLAIAVDALGADKVQAVMMPFKYTAQMSVEDAKEEAEALGIEFDIVSIEPMFDSFMNALEPLFKDSAKDTTEENLQARSRGVILMALSNKKRRIVLTTGNKSEMAVGYCTLYGDMAGGFAVIKDVPKTMVYKLSRYRNTLSQVIPERVIVRPPSAELAPDQVDQDSLPPYDELDAILEAYVENDLSLADIVALGHEEAIVRKVMRLVDINEYKRRQSAIGPKVTPRNFGKDRRYPITSGFGREHG